MRKSFYIWILAGAAALAAVGCQREQTAPSPLYNPETREVTAQFVLNVAAAGQNAHTKQTAEAVQKAGNFRGMKDVHIYAFSTNTASGSVPYVLKTQGWTDADVKDFPLGLLYANEEISNDQNDNQENSSRRVLQLSIPVGTDAVTFYGKAVNADNPTTDQSSERGRTTPSYSVNPKDIEFRAYRRIGNEDDITAYDATAGLMIFVINRIMSSEVSSGGSQDSYSSLPALTWKELGARYEYNNSLYDNRFGLDGTKVPLVPLEEILGKVYSTFTYIKSTEYRAGSSAAIKYMMQNMYSVVRPVSVATPTNAEEANAKRLALEIERRMDRYFKDTWEYRSKDEIKEIVLNNLTVFADETAWDAEFGDARELNDYPYGSFHIPEGAAQLAFNPAAGTFSYLHPNKPLVNASAGTFDPKKYVYPAELMYHVNSPLRTTNQEVTSDNLDTLFPNGTTPWNTEDNWSGWTSNGKVTSSTRSIAVKNNINYGVALLKTSVALSANTLKDNRFVLSGEKEADQNIVFSETSHPIILTGVLVGGVNPCYNWQFLRKYTTEPSALTEYTKFDGVIYDDNMASTQIPTPTGKENYTLVYDNYDSDAAETAQRDVYIALEFQNKGADFWGRDNLIPNGSKFYLVALLTNTSERQNSITWPADHQIPPIYGVDDEEVPSGMKAGESKQIPRIFIQDFMTTAVFTLNENSLKKAYYSMPDLRSSNMSLGLSVDLQWEPGYVFNDLVF